MSSEENTQYITKQAALEALGEEPYNWNDSPEEITELATWRACYKAIENLPEVLPYSQKKQKSSNKNIFEGLTDSQIYVLSRALIESSTIFVIGDEITGSRYTEDEQKIHNDLLNMISYERRKRGF